MNRLEDMIHRSKINELLGKKEVKKKNNTVLWVFAIIGAIIAGVVIAYAVYRYFTPDYLEDFEDEFEEEFDDDFFEDEVENKKEEFTAKSPVSEEKID